MSSPSPGRGPGVLEISQLGLVASILSLGYVFWIVGAMEMVERLAYYGVRSVAGLYAKSPLSQGGLGITPAEYGTVLMVWSAFQGFVPIFVGGLADRYGYKKTIAASTVIKIVAYLIMAAWPSFWGFLGGAIFLALGTAVFKPGIQGTLVKATNRRNSSMAWGIFYQTVNVGSFLGPLMAGLMRKMAWEYVFLCCAAIISLNFLLLLTYREPGMEERLERERQRREKGEPQKSLVSETLRELRRPELALFLAIFTGFYFMFYALFDVLPLHLDDWVDTRDVVATVSRYVDTANPVVRFVVILDKSGQRIQPEGIMNVNSALIMLTCFLVAWMASRIRILRSIALGAALASLSLFLIGSSTAGWMALGAISIFSLGEMLASPRFGEFIGGHLAPDDKKAMYLGLGQMSAAVGSTLEGKLGPLLYDLLGSKERFARELLVQQGMTARAVAGIPQGEAFDRLVVGMGQTPEAVTRMLYESHHVGVVWLLMASVGLVTAGLLLFYAAWRDRHHARG